MGNSDNNLKKIVPWSLQPEAVHLVVGTRQSWKDGSQERAEAEVEEHGPRSHRQRLICLGLRRQSM